MRPAPPGPASMPALLFDERSRRPDPRLLPRHAGRDVGDLPVAIPLTCFQIRVLSIHYALAVSFKRALGPFDATMVVIGGIVGSGIFINPYLVARTLDTPALVLGAWIAGGAIALAGAFAYAE